MGESKSKQQEKNADLEKTIEGEPSNISNTWDYFHHGFHMSIGESIPEYLRRKGSENYKKFGKHWREDTKFEDPNYHGN